MSTIDFLTANLERSLAMFQGTLADFTEAELLVRPTPGANHAAWQIGHLAVSEGRMLGALAPSAVKALPGGFADKFTKETAKLDDSKAFPAKAELLAALSEQRSATVAWAKTLGDADLAKPTPEAMQRFAATIGALLAMMPVHSAMHLGQIQVIRRKLGRPIMF